MQTLYHFYSISPKEKLEWEVSHSSLARLKHTTYEECRSYACKSITDGLTKISIKKGEIIDIPYGTSFNFIGRVDTSLSDNNPIWYYQAYIDRNFISYSTICNQNISHYKGDVFFAYNIYPEDIVHIFPMDSDIDVRVSEENDLTPLPSLWLSLSDLTTFSNKLGVYNQVTIRTKRNGKIYKPFAVITFEQTSSEVQEIADLFEIGTIILHPNKDAVNYTGDLLYDCFKLNSISEIIEKTYGFSVTSMYYPD